MAKDQPDEQESDVRRVSREGRHASINPKLLRKFQSRCWLELRCNPRPQYPAAQRKRSQAVEHFFENAPPVEKTAFFAKFCKAWSG